MEELGVEEQGTATMACRLLVLESVAWCGGLSGVLTVQELTLKELTL